MAILAEQALSKTINDWERALRLIKKRPDRYAYILSNIPASPLCKIYSDRDCCLCPIYCAMDKHCYETEEITVLQFYCEYDDVDSIKEVMEEIITKMKQILDNKGASRECLIM